MNGGSGGSDAGGGGGGRLAVYWSKSDWWFGHLQAGGSTGPRGPGAAGTVYREVGMILGVLFCIMITYSGFSCNKTQLINVKLSMANNCLATFYFIYFQSPNLFFQDYFTCVFIERSV